MLRTRRAHAYRSRRAALICQTSHERHAFGPQLWTSCPAGTRKAEGSAALPSRVQQRCPRAPTPEPGKGHRPQNRAKGADPRTGQRAPTPEPGKGRRPQNRAKGADPRTGTPKKGETCFCTGSWPTCAGAFLVPGRWFPSPAPSGSCLFWFRHLFLSIGRGRHVPAPSGRDVGSNSGAPTQEPAFSGIPIHLLLFNLVFAYSAASVLVGEVSEAVYECGRGGERSR